MSEERKLRIYSTYETEVEREYVTEISESKESEYFNRKISKQRLRIKDANYDENEIALEFSLKGKNLSRSYAIIECNIIESFLKDMQVPEDLELEDKIKALRGRTLDGIFNIENGWFCGLCPTAYKGELSPYESERIKQKVGGGVNEYEILKINKKLTDEDYTFANELEKLGLLNMAENK